MTTMEANPYQSPGVDADDDRAGYDGNPILFRGSMTVCEHLDVFAGELRWNQKRDSGFKHRRFSILRIRRSISGFSSSAKRARGKRGIVAPSTLLANWKQFGKN